VEGAGEGGDIIKVLLQIDTRRVPDFDAEALPGQL